MNNTNTDGESCHFCGEQDSAALEAHHIIPQRYGGSDEPENLVHLCGACHNKIESLYDEKFYRKFAEQSSIDRGENGGESVDPRHSFDRMIPPKSPHMQIEKLEYFVTMDEPAREYAQKDGLEKPRVPDWKLEMDAQERRKLEEAAYEANGGTQQQPVDGIDISRRKHTGTFPKNYRMHCSYCHQRFTKNQHSDLAQHLRRAHGVENPYELEDSTFGEPPEPPEFSTEGLL